MSNQEVKKEFSFDLTKASVCIALPCYSGMIPLELGLNLAQLGTELYKMGIGFSIVSERENALIQSARNRLMMRFLDETDANYLFFLDDDIIFDYQDFLNVFAPCTKYNVVAGAYPARKEQPTFFVRTPDPNHIEMNELRFIKSKGTGLGFCCLKREVIEKIVEGKSFYDDRGVQIPDVFKTEVKDGKFYGEDILFFEELYSLGYPVWINPFVKLKHMYRKDLDYSLAEFASDENLKQDKFIITG